MPIDYEILAGFGTTNERLKEIFTAIPLQEQGAPRGETEKEKIVRVERERKNARDLQTRERFRRKIQTRVEEGIVNSLRHWRMYAAVDLAWDSAVINKMTLPLQMYAQGKINVERCAELLTKVPGGKDYLQANAGGQVSVDVPRFLETNVNLVRSVISRRHGAQRNKFNQLWPYYKYESRSTGIVGKCRADVLSQRVDMMVDQFGYRHHDAQVMRDGFLYGHSLDFVRSSWEIEKQYRRKDVSGRAGEPVRMSVGDTGDGEIEAVIVKEGCGWFNPHPSRTYWDNAYPLASINSDSGCEWVGFWDVHRFSEIDDNPQYFNKASVGWTGRFWGDAGVYNTYKDYFTHYQYTIIPPSTGEIDPSKANDRASIVGFYSGNQRDASVFVSNYFEKVVPKDWGIGDYPWPVWVRLVTASDSTTIFAEWLPSTPGAYLGINENDSRQVNVSMAMELFSYQDAMTNLLTHLMLVCQMEVFKAIGINKDLFDPPDVEAIEKQLKGRNWAYDPIILKYSLLKMQESGVNVDKAIQIAETRQGATISSIFEAIIKLVELTEKLMALSPAEQGQPAPREISATEVNEIANTTSSVYSSISGDIDEFRAAKKRIVYESIVSCHKGEIVCPVKDRYTNRTIVAAGFTAKAGEDEDFRGDAVRRTVIGSRRQLVHDYIFTTRDGEERPVNSQAANTLVQLIGQVLSVPQVAQGMGKEKLYELFNEVFRLSGAGVDLNLTLKEGEDNSLGADPMAQLQQMQQEMGKYLNVLAGQVKQQAQGLAEQEQVNAQQQDALKGLSDLAQRVKSMAGDVNELQTRHGEINKKLIESLSYKDAPPSVRRQMELQAGLQPATDEENAAQLTQLRQGNGAGKK